MSMFWVYVVTRLAELHDMMAVVMVIALLVAALYQLMCTVDHDLKTMNDKGHEIWSSVKWGFRRTLAIWLIAVVCGAVSLALPSFRDLALMLGVPRLSNSKVLNKDLPAAVERVLKETLKDDRAD